MKNKPSHTERIIENVIIGAFFTALGLMLVNTVYVSLIARSFPVGVLLGMISFGFALGSINSIRFMRTPPIPLGSWSLWCLLIGATLYGPTIVFALGALFLSDARLVTTPPVVVILVVVGGLGALMLVVGWAYIGVKGIREFMRTARSTRRYPSLSVGQRRGWPPPRRRHSWQLTRGRPERRRYSAIVRRFAGTQDSA